MFIVYTFSEEEKEAIKIALKNEKNLVVKERLQVLQMTMQNFKRYEVAKILNRHPEFVGRWLKRYKEFGVESLSEKRGEVRHHHLTWEQEEFVKNIVTNSLPSNCNYSQPI